MLGRVLLRRTSRIIFPDTIRDTPLNRAGDSIRDSLCLITTSPDKRIESTYRKALKLLGFISHKFQHSSSFKALFSSLVRPILEYSSVLRHPQTACG